MKALAKPTKTGRSFGLITSVLIVLGGLSTSATVLPIVDETFDPPFLVPLGDWGSNGAINVVREYTSDGVGGSTAVQISAEFVADPAGNWVTTLIYQSGVVGGNDLATPENTVLSFDLKIDPAGMQNVTVYLQSWIGYGWNAFDPGAAATASVGTIPLASYTPGEFQHVVVPLDAKLWVQDTYPDPNNPLPLFDPSGRTYQIAVSVDSGSLPNLGPFTVTVDNLQLATRNPMIPWNGTVSGDLTWTEDLSMPVSLLETGSAAHVGAFVESVLFNPDGTGDVTITADNGDKLFGKFYVGLTTFTDTSIQTEVGVLIDDGTGRFKGAVGSLTARATWSDPTFTHYTATAWGALSTVGANKKH